ncbi:universal stress protein [Halorubrum sp. JWXQ-INN 858]|uniref:universal stress protein n=1 Tax=Halorubrum sp. JWXQ-INN 858 TaxID=2690782 RepID=UPI001357CC08|nr:universal stress protein [Halorubrum sp. JWXQ-INN 858]MWV64128.1 universal stress protein [Halorubrum sp. JWXQ-INN 858]
MYRVLVGIDVDEDRAIAQAEAIAALPAASEDVTAHLCHVFGDNPEGASVHQLAAVRRARTLLEDAGVSCVHYEASGRPAEELVAAAEDIDADAICLSGRKRSPAGKAVFGSVTQGTILTSDRPVFAVPGPTK